MMQAHILNFGAGDRIINDSDNSPFKVPVGALITHDVHEVHYRMIRQGMAKETLFIVPSNLKLTDKMQGIMDLLPHCGDMELDALTSQFNKVMGHHPDGIRPTRDMIRIALREGARTEVRQSMMTIGIDLARVTIREQGDDVTRQQVKLPAAEDLRPSRNPDAIPPEKRVPGTDKKKITRERL